MKLAVSSGKSFPLTSFKPVALSMVYHIKLTFCVLQISKHAVS